MEKKHKQRMVEKFTGETGEKQIIILDIPDVYAFMDEELIDDLQAKVSAYIHI